MSDIDWVGQDGDWNDPTNWSNGQVPTTTDVATFLSSTDGTIEGSAYFGSLVIANCDLTVSGDFGSDGINLSQITDQEASNGTLDVDSWASMQLNNLFLTSTFLSDEGTLLTGIATISSGLVDGSSAEWVGSQTTVTGTLSITDGAAVFGNLSLVNEAVLQLDSVSNIADGDLTVSGDTSIVILPSIGMQSDSQMVNDSIHIAASSTLTIQSDAGTSISLKGVGSELSLIDEGTLFTNVATISNGLVDGSSAKWIGSQTTVTGTLSATGGAALIGNLSLLNGALLQLDSASDLADGTITVNGDTSIVFLPSSATQSGSQVINDFINIAASSTLTIRSETAAPIFLAGGESGPGLMDISDTDLGFAPQSTSQQGVTGSDAATPPSDYVISDSILDLTNEVSSFSTSTVITAKGSSDTVFGGSNAIAIYSATTDVSFIELAAGDATVLGLSGSLSVVGGTGDLDVYDANSADTIVGGVGNNTLVGGAGSSIIATGDGLNIIGTGASGVLLNALATAGMSDLFSGIGAGTTTMIGGSGSDVFVGQSGFLSIQCGSGSDSVWVAGAEFTTIRGGAGNDVMQSSSNAQIALTGDGDNVVVSGGGTTNIDTSGFSGSLVLFSIGSASITVSDGAEDLTAVVGSSHVFIGDAQDGSVVWCLEKADVNMNGTGSHTIVLAGDGDTISASSTVGTNHIFLSSASSPTIQLSTGSAQVICSSSNALLQLDGGQDSIFAGTGSLSLSFASDTTLPSSVVVLDFNPSLDTIDFGSDAMVAVQTDFGLSISFGHTDLLLYGFFGQVPASNQ